MDQQGGREGDKCDPICGVGSGSGGGGGLTGDPGRAEPVGKMTGHGIDFVSGIDRADPLNLCVEWAALVLQPTHPRLRWRSGFGIETIWSEEFHDVQIAISCKHGHLDKEEQEYVNRKSEKLLTYFERVTAIQVTFSFDDHRVRVEILVDAEHKHNFVAFDEGESAIPSFDLALHKMEQQIKKYKEKIQDHRRDRPLNELVGE